MQGAPGEPTVPVLLAKWFPRCRQASDANCENDGPPNFALQRIEARVARPDR